MIRAISFFSGVLFFISTVSAFAGVCDRSITWDTLDANTKARLNRGEQVPDFKKQSSGYYAGYVYKYANYDPELVMGVFTSANEHAGGKGLGSFILKSEIMKGEELRNPYRVRITQKVDYADDAEYLVLNVLNPLSGGGYILTTSLLQANDASYAPKTLDSYFKVMPRGRGVFVVACTYMVPHTGWFKGRYNDTTKDRVDQAGKNLLEWVKRVESTQGLANSYRERVKLLLSPR